MNVNDCDEAGQKDE